MDLDESAKELAARLKKEDWTAAQSIIGDLSTALEAEETKTRYTDLRKDYLETLESFLEHVQVEISLLQKKDLPIQTCFARLVESATTKRIALQERINRLSEEIEEIET